MVFVVNRASNRNIAQLSIGFCYYVACFFLSLKLYTKGVIRNHKSENRQWPRERHKMTNKALQATTQNYGLSQDWKLVGAQVYDLDSGWERH